MNILLVDDDDVSVKAISLILESEGHEVTSCSNGMEALPLLQKNNFDILISDILMPEMDGLELLRTVKKKFEDNIYIVGMSAGSHYLSKELSLSSAKLNADEVLEKPLTKTDIISVLTNASERLATKKAS